MDKYNTPVFTSLVEISRLANTLQSVMDMGMEDITSRQWLPLMILGRCEEAVAGGSCLWYRARVRDIPSGFPPRPSDGT